MDLYRMQLREDVDMYNYILHTALVYLVTGCALILWLLHEYLRFVLIYDYVRSRSLF
jgi:hypothetical protein